MIWDAKSTGDQTVFLDDKVAFFGEGTLNSLGRVAELGFALALRQAAGEIENELAIFGRQLAEQRQQSADELLHASLGAAWFGGSVLRWLGFGVHQRRSVAAIREVRVRV